MGLGAAAACIEPRGYPCEASEQCVLEGVRGRCEPEGWCSYPDEDCDGGNRFESRAPGELAGRCIEPLAGTGTGTSGTGSEGESTGPGPAYTCPERPCATKGLVVGDAHGCVRDGEDLLWCWGSNEHGQLGRGDTTPAERCPARAVELDAVARASASRHMCALDAVSRVFCWGDNADGQVDWHGGTDALVRSPVEVLDLGFVPEVLDVGLVLSCVASGSTVECWGQVGEPPPATLATSDDVTALAAGSQHACAVIRGGKIECVGVDTSGQLGDGMPATDVALEEARPIESGARLVDAGYLHTCAVVTTELDTEVQCWGDNEYQQCGAPNDDESGAIVETPTRVSNLVEGPYQALALGARHSCVLAEDGRVQCWGDNAQGQVGPEAPPGFGAHTVVLDGQELRAVEIGAGRFHTCARTADDRVVCWGDNGALQLGAMSSEDTRTHHWLEIGCE